MDMMGEQGGMPPEQGQEGGYCIEIYVGPGNKVQSVSMERKEAPAMDDADGGYSDGPDSAADAGKEPSMPAQDIKQALDMAMQIYQSGGKMGGAPAPEDEMGQAMQGYGDGGLRGRPGMNVRKVLRED